jgi:ATP-dependent Zn protease
MLLTMSRAASSSSRSVVGAIGLVLTIAACSGPVAEDDREMPYSELLQAAARGEVQAVIQDGTTLSVTLEGDDARRTVIVSEQLNVRQELCAAAGAGDPGDCQIRYEFAQPSAAGQWLGLLITALLPVLLIGGFIFFMMKRAASMAPRS